MKPPHYSCLDKILRSGLGDDIYFKFLFVKKASFLLANILLRSNIHIYVGCSWMLITVRLSTVMFEWLFCLNFELCVASEGCSMNRLKKI